MSRIINVLGVHATEHNPWGGLFDVEIENPTEDEQMLINAIWAAGVEKQQTGHKFGSVAMLHFPNDVRWMDTYPQTVEIETLVLIYVD